MTTKEMLQFRREVTKFHVSDGILHRARQTNEPLAKVIVSAQPKRKRMEAVHELRGHRGRDRTLRNVVNLNW